jgi:mono/diheme cytochrome c family protein
VKGRVTVVAMLVVVAAASGLLLFREALRHGFSAREEPWAIEAFAARRLRRLATGSEAKKLANPLQATPVSIAEGRDHFADHCAVCHANDGSGKTIINEGLYPPAPDLRQRDTQELADGELLYIIRNGIRFTGMPGWGGEDEENWKLVLFIRHLPQLSEEELRLMEEINPEGSQGGEHLDH